MKAESTIKRKIAALRRFRTANDDVPEYQIAVRVAWEIEHVLRSVVEDVRGWPDVVSMAVGCADVIKSDLARKP